MPECMRNAIEFLVCRKSPMILLFNRWPRLVDACRIDLGYGLLAEPKPQAV